MERHPAEHQSSYYYILKSVPAYPLKNVARDGEVFMCCAVATKEFVLVGNRIQLCTNEQNLKLKYRAQINNFMAN